MSDLNSQSLYRNPWQLFKAIFGIQAPVDRRLYLVVGFSLMVLKYAVETGLIYLTSNLFFDPLGFLIPSASYRDQFFQDAPVWVPWAVIVWSIPFVWISVTMSVRRAVDAGFNPFVGLLVLVPIFNLFIMFYLAAVGSVDPAPVRPKAYGGVVDPKHKKQFVYSAILGVVVGGVFSLVVTIISANMMHNYGASLFMGMPLVAGAAAGFVYNQPYTKGVWSSLGVGALAVTIGGLGLLLFALEGVVCLVMASPMLLPLGAAGGLLGWFLSTVVIKQSKWMLGGATLLMVPVVGVFELATTQYEPRVVESSTLIAAAPDEVWENVIAFPKIDADPAWYFRWGLATPLRARIEGKGVGAIRYCEFTTGSFVEPITVWDRPNRLAFDVTEQPDPLIELTPYKNIRPPHLAHSFYSVQGEFELVDKGDGTTQLIGRTWYVVEMGPTIYWQVWTDEIIHQIHLRVLEHIAQTTIDGKKLN